MACQDATPSPLAFSRPDADDPARGIRYDANADRRSWRALEDFLAEVFGV